MNGKSVLDRTGKRILIVAVPLIVAAWVVTNLLTGPSGGPLDDIPPAKLARVAKHWDGRSRLDHLLAGEPWSWKKGPLRKALEAAGPDGPRILLRLILDDRTPRGGVTTGAFWEDEENEPFGAWLAAHPDPRIEPEFLALAADRTRHPEVRRTAIIALCRPGNTAAMAPLVDLAIDPAEDTNVRQAVLRRLFRIGGKAPARLHELLYVPFEELDRTAAAALAACGDPEATSFVTELLDEPLDPDSSSPEWDQMLAVRGAMELTGECSGQWEVLASNRGNVGEQKPGALRSVSDRLRAWLAGDPARRDTVFERDLDEYRSSDRRRRELAILALPPGGMARLPEAELDLGAAALALDTIPGPIRRRLLFGLHRLSLLVKRDLRGDETPEEVLAAMARRLVPERRKVLSADFLDRMSFLGTVLHTGWGDEVGFTLLYLVVAERLGLPLVAVRGPEGMFVRWDDGAARVDALPAQFGELRPGLTGEALSRREVLGVVLSLAASRALDRESYEWARAAANAAVDLLPDEPDAYQVRALASYHLTSTEDEAVIADLRRAGNRRLLAAVLLEMGRHREALTEWEGILAEEPGDRAARIARARCRLALGEREIAFAELRDMAAEAPGDPGLEHLRLELLAYVRDPAWREGLTRIEAPEEDPLAHLAVAGALLEGREPDPAAALEVLDAISAFGETSWKDLNSFESSGRHDIRKEIDERTARTVLTKETYNDLRRRYFLLRARATLLTGDRGEARTLLDRAEGIGGPTRDTRLLRRELDRR